MLRLETHEHVVDWLASLNVRRIIIVSPHLDDAVFSLGGFISAVPEIVDVITVNTEGELNVAVDWALAGGFSDPIQEHATRRQEDERAMSYLGCGFRHLGLRGGDLSEVKVRNHLQALWDRHSQPVQSVLFLLPAGAGGDRPLSTTRRWFRKILRKPIGPPAHPEHEDTRDHFWRVLAEVSVRLGFYAEFPYIWNEVPTVLRNRLSRRYVSPLDTIQIRPHLEKKLSSADCYRSQVGLVLGEKPTYRRRVLDMDEHIFLAPEPGRADHIDAADDVHLQPISMRTL